MEMAGIGATLWATAQAATVQQVALTALVALAAAAALYVLVQYVLPETAAIAHQVYEAVTPFRGQRPSEPRPDSPSPDGGDPKGSTTEDVFEDEFIVRRRYETTLQRFQQAFGRATTEETKGALIEEIVNWLEGSKEGDGTDVSKIYARLEGYLKQLTEGKWDHLKSHCLKEGNIITVKANGNCGYYAAAGRMLLMNIDFAGKLDNPADNFIDLAAQLRAKAFELAHGELDIWGEVLLTGAMETWVEGRLRDHFTQVLSMLEDHMPPRPWEPLQGMLNLTPEEAQQAHEKVVSQVERRDTILAEGLSQGIVQECINIKSDEHFKALYKEKISQHAPDQGGGRGFWASPFELYLLAKHFDLPLRITRPDEENIVLNTEAEGRLWLEVNYNGIDHFDMVVPD